jgi:prepilin-type N-terminal cleavage/methylation domain-containing protein
MKEAAMFRRKRACGFTLIELLVVIAVIGVLIALLLPAVQAARETARRLECQNHLKHLSLGCLSHESALHFFPSGGWGGNWIGDPDYGFGKTQPGSWGFNILPFIEEKSLYKSFSGILKIKKYDTMPEPRIATPIVIFNCPSRRLAIAYPWKQNDPEGGIILLGYKSDYAINAGSEIIQPLPVIDAEVDPSVYPLPKPPDMNGISYQLSAVPVKEIINGTSRTYLVGEKYLNPNDYTTLSLENILYAGFDESNFRIGMNPPYRDRRNFISEWGFGSVHAAAWHMSFCDGSVRAISYDIDPKVHKCQSNRRNKIPF